MSKRPKGLAARKRWTPHFSKGADGWKGRVLIVDAGVRLEPSWKDRPSGFGFRNRKMDKGKDDR